MKLEGDGMNQGVRRMPLRYRLAAVGCICKDFCSVVWREAGSAETRPVWGQSVNDQRSNEGRHVGVRPGVRIGSGARRPAAPAGARADVPRAVRPAWRGHAYTDRPYDQFLLKKIKLLFTFSFFTF